MGRGFESHSGYCGTSRSSRLAGLTTRDMPRRVLRFIDWLNHLGRKPYCWIPSLCVWTDYQEFLRDYRWDPDRRVWTERKPS